MRSITINIPCDAVEKANDKTLIYTWLLVMFVMLSSRVHTLDAQEEGPVVQEVKHGEVTVQRKRDKLIIEASDKSIIRYSEFDIPSDFTVRFEQPSSQARVLNRDRSGNRTRINGRLTGKGQVYLTNPAGIGIGPSATIDVGRFVAAAGHISDESFLNGTDRFSNLQGSVVNEGEIIADGIDLLGEQVENYGKISAPHGTITMSAGKTVYLGKATGHTFVEIQKTGDGSTDGTAVTNEGTITAEGGSARLAAGDLYSTGIQQAGVVSTSDESGGDISITAGTDVRVTGDVMAKGTDGAGGTIDVVGQEDTFVLDARVDASGTTGGGTVRVGGPQAGEGKLATAQNLGVSSGTELNADATLSGDGGNVVAWSDGMTMFDGTASAEGGPEGGEGGFVEISGSSLDTSLSAADVSAPAGKNGTVLYDPDNIEIIGGSADGEDSEAGNDSTLLDDTNDSDSGTSNTGELLYADTDVAGGDGNGTFEVFESELEETVGDITLHAKNSIFTSGTFDYEVSTEGTGVLLVDGNLTLETRNSDSQGDAAGAIDLTGSDHGAGLRIETQGSGTVRIEAGSANDLTSDVLVPNIITADERIDVESKTGSIRVAGKMDAGTGTIQISGNPVFLEGELVANTLSGMGVKRVLVENTGRIQDGVSLVQEGGRVSVAPGTFEESIQIEKSLTLAGPNEGIEPGSSDRGAEAVIDGSSLSTGETLLELAPSSDGDIDGLTIDGLTLKNIPKNSGGTQSTGHGIAPEKSNEHLLKNVTVQNNVFDNRSASGDDHRGVGIILDNVEGLLIEDNHLFRTADYGSSVTFQEHAAISLHETLRNNRHEDVVVRDNLIDDAVRGIWVGYGNGNKEQKHFQNARIENNIIKNIDREALRANPEANTGDEHLVIAENEIVRSDESLEVESGRVEILRNHIHTKPPFLPNAVSSEKDRGIEIDDGSVTVRSNRVSDQGTGVLVNGGAGSLTVRSNDLAGNGIALDNRAASTVNASKNWWGTTNDGDILNSLTNGSVDVTPFLGSGVDTDPGTPGFQPDFGLLGVTEKGSQIGPTGRINEGLNCLKRAGRLTVQDGTYNEDVELTFPLTLDNAGTVFVNSLSSRSTVTENITLTGGTWETTGGGSAIDLQSPVDLPSDLTLRTTTGDMEFGESLTSSGQLTLDSGGSISSDSDAPIVSNNGSGLAIRSNGPVQLAESTNDVDRLAANVTGANEEFSFRNQGQLMIDTVDGTSGINMNDGNVTLSTGGGLSVNEAVQVGEAELTAVASGGDIVLNDTMSVKGTGNQLVLSTEEDFINRAGPSALQASDGARYLVYSTDPARNRRDGLSFNFVEFGKTYPTPPEPSSIGNGAIYSVGVPFDRSLPDEDARADDPEHIRAREQASATSPPTEIEPVERSLPDYDLKRHLVALVDLNMNISTFDVQQVSPERIHAEFVPQLKTDLTSDEVRHKALVGLVHAVLKNRVLLEKKDQVEKSTVIQAVQPAYRTTVRTAGASDKESFFEQLLSSLRNRSTEDALRRVNIPDVRTEWGRISWSMLVDDRTDAYLVDAEVKLSPNVLDEIDSNLVTKVLRERRDQLKRRGGASYELTIGGFIE